MEDSERNIQATQVSLAMISEANIKMIAQGNFFQAYSNLASKLRYSFDIGMFRWRRNEAPVADLKAVLATGREMLRAIDEWSIPEARVAGSGYVWDLTRYASFLLSDPVALSSELLALVRREQGKHADMAMEYHLLDAIEGREWRAGLKESFDQLASKKRQALAVDSYQTYFALIQANAHGAETEALIKRAENNYVQRAKDEFYSGGPIYMGGGLDNPYVVDFTLAAILKKIGWQGESIHKWRWDTV